MKFNKTNIIIIILLIFVILNVFYFIKIRYKIHSKKFFVDDVRKINLDDFKPMNFIQEKKSYNKFIYVYRFSDCEGCIYNMFRSIQSFSKINNSSIHVIIVYDNFKEAIIYWTEFYAEKYPEVKFYFASYEKFEDTKIKYTPFLIVSRENKAIFSFHFNLEIKELWEISKKINWQ